MEWTRFACVFFGATTGFVACSGGGGGQSVDYWAALQGAEAGTADGPGSGGNTGSGSSTGSSGSGSASSSGSTGGGTRDAGGLNSGAADASGGNTSGPDSSAGTDGGSGIDSAATIRYATQVGPLLDTNCTNACHGGCGGLNISYTAIVNVPSGQVASLNYVTPNDPGRSYLFCKVAPQDAACTSAGTMIRNLRMPPGGPYLSAANLNLIKTWIQQGAPQ